VFVDVVQRRLAAGAVRVAGGGGQRRRAAAAAGGGGGGGVGGRHEAEVRQQLGVLLPSRIYCLHGAHKGSSL
jgi:hypothetical protein